MKPKQEWIKQLGSASSDYAKALAADDAGNVYIGGHTYGTMAEGEARGGGDAWLAKFFQEPESFADLNELERLRFQFLYQYINRKLPE